MDQYSPEVENDIEPAPPAPPPPLRGMPVAMQIIVGVGVLGAIAAGVFWYLGPRGQSAGPAETASQVRTASEFRPTPEQWAALTLEPVQTLAFRSEQVTEGKIAVDEDRATSIFSPYAGRVTKLLVAPGEKVERGQPLFIVEAADSVQGQNEVMTALASVNKARSQVNLTQTIERRLHTLYEGKAIALKDWQQAQADLLAAQNDLRSTQTALEAARNRLRIIGKTDEEIDAFIATGTIKSDAPIYAPISGVVVQRKVGPGQYVTAGSTDPVFVIGDLSTVWLVAYVRETEAPKIEVGQPMQFTVLAYPDRIYEANVAYVATTLDPVSRRLLVRAVVNNASRQLKPEMFASVGILTGASEQSVGVPRDAVIYEGDTARVWVAREDHSVVLRQVRTGLVNGKMIQIVQGLKAGERVVTKGSLFIDRAAVSS